LQHSLQTLVQRHESLRTTFTSLADQLLQVVIPTFPLPLTVRDLRTRPATARVAEAQALLQEASERPLTMAQGPLFALDLVHIDDQEHYVLFTVHHSISDGWSLGVLVRELVLLYTAYVTAQPVQLPALPVQYIDVAAW